MRHRRFSSHAFTLIELLVTVAIISILAALLLTGINNSKNAAHATKCRSNLKQIQLGMLMYVQDTEHYPIWGQDYPGSDAVGRFWWFNSIKPYTGHGWTDPLYRCPAYKGITTENPPVSEVGPQLGSYGLNRSGVFRPSRGEVPPDSILGLEGNMPGLPFSTIRTPWRATDIKVPSDMIAVGDAFHSVRDPMISGTPYSGGALRMESNTGEIGVNGWASIGFGTRTTTPEFKKNHGESPENRHGGKSNVTFCDGHVEGFKYQKLYLESSPEILQKWNRDHEPHADRFAN